MVCLICLQDCDLGEQSILHAVRSRTNTSSSKRASRPLNEALKDLQLSNIVETPDDVIQTAEETAAERKRVHFYVFCSSPCGGMREGKLRVRCSTCKSGAITVDSDPRCWQDVLEPHRISGHCEQENCPVSKVILFYFSLGTTYI